MTDDTSDDRMDRAQRIREMREGSRPDDAPEEASATAATPSGEADDGSPDNGSEGAADWFDDADGANGTDATDAASGVDTPDVSDGADASETAEPGSDAESPFGDGMPQVPGMNVDDASVDAEVLAEQAGLEASAGSASAQTVERPETVGEGGDDAAAAVGMASARSGDAVTGGTAEDETRVLEFALAEERYCLDIEYVEEIVKRDTVTRVPNTPDYVAGVVDLRGQITTILDPKVIFDIDAEGSEELIVVFDPEGFDDQGAIGWLVDDVNQVMPVADSEVNPSPVDQKHVEGVVDRDGEFVIWTTPERAVEDATG
jgi:purine-binding chemotaxis protein CheW